MHADGKDGRSIVPSNDPTGLSPEALAKCDLGGAMVRIRTAKLDLCQRLETIADSLPGNVDPNLCLVVAQSLTPVLRHAHRFEETMIFPVYTVALPSEVSRVSTGRLRTEHIEDECFAADLTDILLKLGYRGQIANAETFGFMLRGFFEGLRRHIAFENEHIAPIIRAIRPDCA